MIAFLFCWLLASPLWAADFVEIYEGHELYVDHVRAEPGKDTLIALHGMTYSHKQWQDFKRQYLKENPGNGLVIYDMYGMGETLLKYKDEFNMMGVSNKRILYHEQAHDLRKLINALDIKGSIYFVGLSYGGGIGQYFMKEYGDDPQFKSVILLSPFMEPLHNQVDWIHQQIRFVKAMQPFNLWSEEQLYDYFLKVLVYTTYPWAEPVILENPYKLEATFRLAQGMKDFSGFELASELPERSIHLVVPTNDEYITPDEFDKYWNYLPEKVRASRLIIPGARHKIPEEIPSLISEWVSRIMNDTKGEYSQGKTYSSQEVRFSKCDSTLSLVYHE